MQILLISLAAVFMAGGVAVLLIAAFRLPGKDGAAPQSTQPVEIERTFLDEPLQADIEKALGSPGPSTEIEPAPGKPRPGDSGDRPTAASTEITEAPGPPETEPKKTDGSGLEQILERLDQLAVELVALVDSLRSRLDADVAMTGGTATTTGLDTEPPEQIPATAPQGEAKLDEVEPVASQDEAEPLESPLAAMETRDQNR